MKGEIFMKRKRIKSIIATILTIVILVSAPPIHAKASTDDFSKKIFEFLTFLSDKPLSIDLFINYLGDGKDMTYWEEEVYPHIKEGIIGNADYQAKLQDVLKLAYQNGHCKIDFISDDTPPSYTEPSFDDTRYNQAVAFNDGDLYYAIHGINGHLVIEATYLGNDQFEVWVALKDYYDFDFDQNCDFGFNVCTAGNVLDFLHNIHAAGTEFYVSIGFTYSLSWCPDTSSNNQTASIAESYIGEWNNGPSVVSQYFWKSDYNEGWYEGEWSDGQPNGYGKLTYDDFADGKYYALTFSTYDCKALYYEGQFSNGYRYGEGTVVYENGYIDEGTFYGSWQDGKIVFQGKRWLINDTYNGYWPITITASGTTTSNTEYGNWQSVK